MENNYYVYGYLRLDTNTYFYIGKGKDNRYLRLDNRNKHFYCVELNRDFPSLNKAVKYIKENYDVLFNKHSLSKYLKGEFKYEWYGEIKINGVLTKLHWNYI